MYYTYSMNAIVLRDLWCQVHAALEWLDCSVEKLTCKDVILGYQLKSDTKLNVGANNVFSACQVIYLENVNF